MLAVLWGGNSDGVYSGGDMVVSAIVLELVYNVRFSSVIGMGPEQLRNLLKIKRIRFS